MLQSPTQPDAFNCAPMPLGVRSSAPMMNMKSTTPIDASAESPGRDAAGNNWACHCGKIAPSTTGPSRMPAAISPTTIGWPMTRSSSPQRRATIRITAS